MVYKYRRQSGGTLDTMEPDDDQFRMVCPKCGSSTFTVRRDQRAYVHKSQPFELVFSCRCGKQLFGDTIQEEYDRQKAEWEARPPEEPVVDEATLRKQEETKRREQLRKAMEHRRTYLAEKRRKQAEAERRLKEEEDRRWRERVAKVESQHGDTAYLHEVGQSRKSKPLYTTRTVAQPAVGERTAKSPSAKAAPAATPAASTSASTAAPAASEPRASSPAAQTSAPAPTPASRPSTPAQQRVIEFDENHPHAEFMALLVDGTFEELFPGCTPPDIKDENLCVWPPCEKPRRKKSKYCSRECSNKNARWRHKMRKHHDD